MRSNTLLALVAMVVLPVFVVSDWIKTRNEAKREGWQWSNKENGGR